MPFNSFRLEAWNERVVETMTFNRFRQEVWHDKVVETMPFSSFRQDARNDRVVEKKHLAVSDKNPGIIGLSKP